MSTRSEQEQVLIVGATSAIAEAVARLYARDGAALYLTGRDEARLDLIARDLQVRGAAAVHTRVWHAGDAEGTTALLDDAMQRLTGLDVVLVAYGALPDQDACARTGADARAALETNLVSVVELLTPIANRMEDLGRGRLAVLSSVAGDRGRPSNYVYGAAKAGLSAFLQGLRARLHRAGVSVITIKPGFVDTPMTAKFERKGLLWATPSRAARGIHKAIAQRKSIAYVPWHWRPIMGCIRAVPEWLFKRMKL